MTSYAKNKREFIDIMRAETPSMSESVALRIISAANTIHDIAEGDASDDSAFQFHERTRVKCPDCQRIGPTDRTYAITGKGRPCPEHRAERRVVDACKPYNVVPSFDGDPRGAVVKLKVPSGRNNSFGGGGWICVPTRKA